jgi:protein-tyrosine phosphatase
MPDKPAILFVCLGNICRSPLAEAAFRAAAESLGLAAEVDSAGTGGWHAGEPPDSRAIETARRHGVDISGTRARQLCPADFRRFTHIVALDRQNLADLNALRPPDSTAAISLLLDHVQGRRGQAVADPYYGDLSGFETTWEDVRQGAEALATELTRTA